MGFFDRIFGFGKAKLNKTDCISRNENCDRLLEYNRKIEELLNRKQYIAKSDYKKLAEDYAKTIDFFNVLS